MVASPSQDVLITGISSGIGHGLATHYLGTGARVWGLSRREAGDLESLGEFHHVSVDLRDGEQVKRVVSEIGASCQRFDLVILNAAVLGRFGDLAEAEMDDLRNTMEVNVWANLVLVRELVSRGVEIGQLVAISSGASVNGHRGWSGYSISKTALNMLMRLLGRELEGTHCVALAPGLVDTAMQETLCSREPDERFPAVERLRLARNTPEMPDPLQAARRLARAISVLPERVESGEYVDVRKMTVED